MTTAHHTATDPAGVNATERFKTDKITSLAQTPPERVSLLARELLAAVHATIREHKVTYDEYHALKAWLINVGEDGEWPLFLDVWVEHVVEEVATEHRHGSKGSIEGPYYVPGAPEIGARGTVPMRADELGTPLLVRGSVTSTDGTPLPEAKIELWHADYHGLYSQITPDIPEWNLRATLSVDDEGVFEVSTIRPAAYEIPNDGACGKLIRAAGWHAWRPAHLHVKVHAPGHELLTAQLYFSGDDHTDDDVADAVKPELLLQLVSTPDREGQIVWHDFVLDPAGS